MHHFIKSLNLVYGHKQMSNTRVHPVISEPRLFVLCGTVQVAHLGEVLELTELKYTPKLYSASKPRIAQWSLPPGSSLERE